jgi:hypothetical protein
MNFKKIIALMIIASCSSVPVKQGNVPSETVIPVLFDQVTRNGKKIERAFIKHVKVFEKHYGEEIGIEIGFAKIPGLRIGICYYSTFWLFAPRILIDKDYWDKAPEAEKEMTILHELGHCILGRAHLETKENMFPASIMYSRSFSDWYYKLNRDKLIKELFNLVKKPMIDPLLAL